MSILIGFALISRSQESVYGPAVEIMVPSNSLPSDFDPTFGLSVGGFLSFGESAPIGASFYMGAAPFAAYEGNGFSLDYKALSYYYQFGLAYQTNGFVAGIEMGQHFFDLAFNSDIKDHFDTGSFSYAPMAGYIIEGFMFSARYQIIGRNNAYFSTRVTLQPW